MSKKAAKSVEKSKPGNGNLKPFKPGPDARRGRGPAKGAPNAGRPPDAWREHMRELASREDIAANLTTILSRPLNGYTDPAEKKLWLDAYRFVTGEAYPKETRVQVEGGTTNTLTVRFEGNA